MVSPQGGQALVHDCEAGLVRLKRAAGVTAVRLALHLQAGGEFPDPFDGRTALVTGGGSGIGRATAVALARRGMNVLVTDRRAGALQGTAELAPGITPFPADVTDQTDIQRAVRAAVAVSGGLHLLVNNAAVLAPAPLGEIAPAAARRVWETNVLGPVLLAQAALPHLTAGSGVIVNVSSTFGAKPAPGVSQYGASKAALDQLTRSWALELASRGIRVNAVAPGPTETEALHGSGRTPEHPAGAGFAALCVGSGPVIELA